MFWMQQLHLHNCATIALKDSTLSCDVTFDRMHDKICAYFLQTYRLSVNAKSYGFHQARQKVPRCRYVFIKELLREFHLALPVERIHSIHGTRSRASRADTCGGHYFQKSYFTKFEMRVPDTFSATNWCG